uniref:Uncharacterized protein n=1 Tax=Fagus sylvatica TaxID=28930 RepID=A0A2N9GB84_FAGSY
MMKRLSSLKYLKDIEWIEIEWYRGKSLTQKILKKKPRKGSKNAKSSTKTEDCPSFLSLLYPSTVHEEEDDLDEDTLKNSKIKWVSHCSAVPYVPCGIFLILLLEVSL